ncbi:MAG TPA: hypothetical protein PLD51_02400 [Pontiellaceae bacterium]|nr:hypothetical protein [Pontiellaceae bacterium]
MKKSILVAMLLGVVASVFAAPQTTCPVLGGPVDHKLYADVNGYRIYVCCGGCIAAVKADPAKYIEKMKAAGVELEKTPVK